jgi:o-succinylbenzoate synthase
LEVFRRLVQTLPAKAILRLDANGGLSETEAARWLEECDRTGRVEFLEQPLPADQVEAMQRLAQQFETPIALDESVATVNQLHACIEQGWSGVMVVKAAIAGSPRRLRHLSQQRTLDLVWSSVFETAIAQRYIFDYLIPSIPSRKPRALGFGVNQWFNDQWSHPDTDDWPWQSPAPLAPF